MSFLNLESSDAYYYELVKNNQIAALKEKLGNPTWIKKINKIIALPTEEDIKTSLHDNSEAFL